MRQHPRVNGMIWTASRISAVSRAGAFLSGRSSPSGVMHPARFAKSPNQIYRGPVHSAHTSALATMPFQDRSVGYSLGSRALSTSLNDVSPDMLIVLSMESGVGGLDHDSLVDSLVHNGFLKSKRLTAAFRMLDRKRFLHVYDRRVVPYVNKPIPIGCGQTMTSSSAHALNLELLNSAHGGEFLRGNKRVLDAGFGSGYIAAVISLLLSGEGRVTGVDVHPEFVSQATELCERLSIGPANDWAACSFQQCSFDVSDYPAGPFDAIHVGFAISADDGSSRRALTSRLANHGAMVIPLDLGPAEGGGWIHLVTKDGCGAVTWRKVAPAAYSAQLKTEADMQPCADKSQAREEMGMSDELIEAELESIAEGIKAWHAKWKHEKGCRPSVEQMQADPIMEACVKRHRQLKSIQKKRSILKSRREEPAQ